MKYKDHLLNQDVINRFYDSHKQTLEYLNNKECREKRIKPKENFVTKKTSIFFKAMSKKHKFKSLREKLLTGNSVGLSYCAMNYQNQEDLSFPLGDSCGGHVVIANGLKFENGKCMVNIRNSWGKSSLHSGWLEVDSFIGYLKDLTSIEKKKEVTIHGL